MMAFDNHYIFIDRDHNHDDDGHHNSRHPVDHGYAYVPGVTLILNNYIAAAAWAHDVRRYPATSGQRHFTGHSPGRKAKARHWRQQKLYKLSGAPRPRARSQSLSLEISRL